MTEDEQKHDKELFNEQQAREARRYRYLRQFAQRRNLSMDGYSDWELRMPFAALGQGRTFDEAVERGYQAQKR